MGKQQYYHFFQMCREKLRLTGSEPYLMKRSKKDQQEAAIHASIDARHEFRRWYKTPLGRSIYEQEKQSFESILPKLFGYNILQLSSHTENDYLQSSPIRHQIIMDFDSTEIVGGLNVQGHAHQLPIASDSVDAVVMPHTLDIDMNPHLVLREADRVLVPEGRVVVLGFNPWSSWGLRHMANLWKGTTPYNLRFVSPSRLKDWLVLLGFEIESVKMFYFRPPLPQSVLIQKLQFMDKWGQKLWPAFGAGYLVVAKKLVSTLTPIKPRWFLRRRAAVTPGFLETRDNVRKEL